MIHPLKRSRKLNIKLFHHCKLFDPSSHSDEKAHSEKDVDYSQRSRRLAKTTKH